MLHGFIPDKKGLTTRSLMHAAQRRHLREVYAEIIDRRGISCYAM
jgi:hypothetical protein